MKKIFIILLLFSWQALSYTDTFRQRMINAAKTGDADSQFALAESYIQGLKGFSVDYKKAYYWMEKAANQGIPEAQILVGTMYSLGRGAVKNKETANYWFKKAKNQGSGIGKSLAEGDLVIKDQQKPHNPIKEARKKALTMKKLKENEEQGNSFSQYLIGLSYYEGLNNLPKDYKKAAYFFKKAANQGNANAQYVLGKMYFFGQGVPQIGKKSLEWLAKAAQQEHKEAKKSFYIIYATIQKDIADKQKLFYEGKITAKEVTNAYYGKKPKKIQTASNTDMDGADSFGILFALALMLGLYFLPYMIAVKRNHYNKKDVRKMNVYLGWTIIFWAIALIWALFGPRKKEDEPQKVVVVNNLKDLESLKELEGSKKLKALKSA